MRAISSRVSAWSAKRQISPASGARPLGMKALKPGKSLSSATASRHWRAMTGLTGNPSRAWRIASTKRSSKGRLPNLPESATHCDTAPGTVTESQPRSGMPGRSRNRSGVHAIGARPQAFRPCSAWPSQIIAKPSPPMPFMVGSTTVSVIAAASAASMALPPRAIAAMPACAASGCEHETMLRARTG